MPSQNPWVGQLLEALGRSNSAGAEAALYVRERGLRLRIHDQPTAARWTLGRNIDLHPRYANGAADSPYALSLVVHEVVHIKQGLEVALSVYGELEAWQAQFSFLRTWGQAFPGAPAQARLIGEMLALPLRLDRSVLRTARQVMQQYAGRRYRVDLLPLFPLRRELAFLVLHRLPQ